MDLPPAVSKRLDNLLPESLRCSMTAFSFLAKISNQSNSNPDIVITTKMGELLEIKDRNIMNSVKIDSTNNIKDIIIHKRKKAKYISYILHAVNDAVFIIVKENIDELKSVKKYSDVAKIEIEDFEVKGDVKVKLWLTDDAIPLVLNDDYAVESETRNYSTDIDNDGDGLCLLLKGKLAQAKMNTAHNKKVLEEKRMLRQELMNLSENVERFDRDWTKQEDVSAVDKLTTNDPWLRVHNEKVIIGVHIHNLYSGSIDEIQLFLRCKYIQLFSYSTKILSETESKKPPYWTQVTKTSINSLERMTYIGIFDCPDFDEFGTITINMALKYTYNGKSLCLPLQNVDIKAFNVVNSKYDPILNLDKDFDSEDLLSVIVASVYEELHLYTIDNEIVDLDKFFIDTLKFSKRSSKHYSNCDMFLTHGQSPMNVLHGMTLYHTNERENDGRIVYKLHIFARSENQILMLVNLIYDQIQARCVVVPKNFTVKMKDDIKQKHKDVESMDISQEMEFDNTNDNKLMELASLLNQQMAAVVAHLEGCMEAMSEANTRNITSKKNDSSISIDVNALGKDKYEQLWSFLIEKMSTSKELLQEIE